MRITLLIMCLLAVLSANSKNYYFSSVGNDLKTGNAPAKAWKNVEKLAALNLKPGDSVLFRRGDTFSAEIRIKNSGKAGKPIVFSAYGKGKLPVLTGAVKLTNPQTASAHLQNFIIPQKVLQIYINNTKQTLARYPNNGYLTIGEGIAKIGFHTRLSQPDGYWNGASIAMRTIDWVFELRKIKSYGQGKMLFDNESIYNMGKGYGYFLQDKEALVDSIGEWYSTDKNVTILWNKSLTSENVEGVIYKNAFVIAPEAKNIVINSITIDKYAANGIWAQKGSSDISIINNEIKNLGYMGIWLDTLVSNVAVRHNKIEDVSGRGISGIRLANSTIEHNTLRRIGLSPGEGVSGVNGMIAIAIENNEKNHALSTSVNNKIAYNEVDSTGYAGIRMDGQNSICEFNIVRNTSLKLNDSGAIYCFGKVKNRTKNNIIRNNLVINAIGNVEATPSNEMATNGIYIDNNSTQVLVEKNTILNVSSSGIHINDGSPLNTIKENIIYNCNEGISFAEWANKDSLFGCFTEGNTLVAVKKSDIAISIKTFLGAELKPSAFKRNSYINFHDGFVFNYKTDPEKGQRRSDLFRLANWQRFSCEEKESRSLELKGVKIIYNDSFSTKNIELPLGNFVNIEGVSLTKNVQLPPCSGMLIIPKN